MKKVLLSFLAFNYGCTQPIEATNVLLDHGFHPINVGGYGWLDCGEGDAFHTRFRAYSLDSSRVVTGCVCSGWFKNSTIRTD